MEWTYNVVVKTEASRSVPAAIDDLTKAQKASADSFYQASRFLSQDFLKTILEPLSEKFKKFIDEDEEGSFDEHFQRVHDALVEVRAALVMMMDFKEGGFTNTLNTLRLASDAMKEASGTIEDAMTEVYKDIRGGMGEIIKESKRKGRFAYEQIPSSIFDPEEESFFSVDPKGEGFDKFKGFTDKLIFAAMGGAETILKDYPETMAKIIKDELNIFLNEIGTGTDLFEKLLERGTQGYKDWKEIQETLGIAIQAKRIKKEKLREEGYDPSENVEPSERVQGIMHQTAHVMSEAQKVFEDPRSWESLKEALQKGFQKQLEETGSSVLKSSETFGIVTLLFNVIFDKIRDSILAEARDESKSRKKASSITRSFREAFKLGKEDIFDLTQLENILGYYVGFSRTENLLDNIPPSGELEQILLKSKAEYEPNATADFLKLEDVIYKNLEQYNLPEIIKTTLSEILANRQFEFGDKLEIEMGEIISSVKNELEKILLIEKLGSSFENILKKVESTGLQAEGGIDPKVSRNATIDFDFDEYYQDAKTHRNDWYSFAENVLTDLSEIFAKLEFMSTYTLTGINYLAEAISNIKIPKQYAATSGNL